MNFEKGKNIVELKATINRELKLLLEKSERSALNRNIYKTKTREQEYRERKWRWSAKRKPVALLCRPVQ